MVIVQTGEHCTHTGIDDIFVESRAQPFRDGDNRVVEDPDVPDTSVGELGVGDEHLRSRCDRLGDGRHRDLDEMTTAGRDRPECSGRGEES